MDFLKKKNLSRSLKLVFSPDGSGIFFFFSFKKRKNTSGQQENDSLINPKLFAPKNSYAISCSR
jgi:hypothetical protein